MKKIRHPLRNDILQHLYRRIMTAKPGAVLGAERSLTAEFGVSLTVVREATLLLEENGFLERKTKIGLIVGDLPRSSMIGVFCSVDLLDEPGVTYWQAKQYRAIINKLHECGARVRIYPGKRPARGLEECLSLPPELLDDIWNCRLGALILVGTSRTALMEQVSAQTGLHIIGGDYRCVDGRDFRTNIRRLEHILQTVRADNRKAPVVMAWFEEEHREWQESAYRDLLSKNGFTTLARPIFGDLNPTLQGAGWEDFWILWRRANRQLDAVVVLDDFLLPDLQKALSDFQIDVPDEVRLYSMQNAGHAMSIEYPMRRFFVDPAAEGGRKAEEAFARLAFGDSFAALALSESPFVHVEESDAKTGQQLRAHTAPEFTPK